MEDRMATLNIKNLPATLSRTLQAMARRERRSVAQEVIHPPTCAVESPAPGSILDLRGLGKELWRDVDATAHVDRERRSWD
jgi:hypothetical protein